MRDGVLEQIGTPAELYEHPTNRFVAEFLGAANILAATVKEVGYRGTFLRLDASPVMIRVGVKAPLGKPVCLALRPERLRLESPNVLQQGMNALDGTVCGIEYRGDALQVSVLLATGAVLRVNHLLTNGLDAAVVEMGAAVRICFAPDAAIVLPP